MIGPTPATSGAPGPQRHAPALSSSAAAPRAIAAFLVIAFTFSWTIGIVAVHIQAQVPLLSTVMTIISGFGPSIAGVIVVAYFSTPLEFRGWIARCLYWRVGWLWLALAFVLPPVLMVMALAIHALLGGEVIVSPAVEHIPLAILNFGLVLVVGGPLGEEFGWRGYAMPVLAARWGWLAASLIIGIVWGIWHLPLFFIVGTAQSVMSAPMFMVNILAGSAVFGWLFERTRGSVLPALVLHTSLNAWVGILGIVPTAATGRPFALVTGLLLVTAVVVLWKLDPKTGAT